MRSVLQCQFVWRCIKSVNLKPPQCDDIPAMDSPCITPGHNFTTSKEEIIRRSDALQRNNSRCGLSSSQEHLSHGVARRWSRTVTVSDWLSSVRARAAIIKHPAASSRREASKRWRPYLTERGYCLMWLCFRRITMSIIRCSWQSKLCNCHFTWGLHPRRSHYHIEAEIK